VGLERIHVDLPPRGTEYTKYLLGTRSRRASSSVAMLAELRKAAHREAQNAGQRRGQRVGSLSSKLAGLETARGLPAPASA